MELLDYLGRNQATIIQGNKQKKVKKKIKDEF
jgi:hypothetical protein